MKTTILQIRRDLDQILTRLQNAAHAPEHKANLDAAKAHVKGAMVELSKMDL